MGERQLPTPPNGGWGWVVVVGSFFSNFIVDGVLYTFGIFLNDLVQTFDVQRSTIGLVGSLLGGIYLIVGPIAGALVNKYGCRKVAIGGSILSSASFFIGTYSSSIEMLIFTYSIGGIGFGMMYLPSIVAVSLYFDTKRAMATGIAVCGSGFGTFVFAPIARILLTEYGWRGANKVLAGIILNAVACGLVYLPLTSKTLPETKTKMETDNNESSAADKLDGTVKEETNLECSPFSRRDVFYPSSITNINEFKESQDVSSYRGSVTNVTVSTHQPSSRQGVCTPLTNMVTVMFDFTLFRSPTFCIVCLSGICAFLGFFTTYVYLVDYATGEGMSKVHASLLTSVMGFSSIIGRLLSGWLADRPWADSLIIHNVAAILAGAATCLLPASHGGSALLFTYSTVFGMTLSAYIALRSIVLCDLLGIQKLTNAFGIVSLFQGIALLIGTPFSGFIYDATGSYTVPFIVAGSVLALGGIVCLPARRVAQWEARRLVPEADQTKPV